MKPPHNQYFDKKLKVYGLNDGQFLINHYWVNGSIIVFPNRFFMWNIIDAEEIKPHTLEIMNFIKPRPDYLIIGTGNENLMLDSGFYEHFKRMGIVVDTCPTFEACSTFNMCVEDDHNVACAMLQPRFDNKPKNTTKVTNTREQEIFKSGVIGLGNESFGQHKLNEIERLKLNDLSKKP